MKRLLCTAGLALTMTLSVSTWAATDVYVEKTPAVKYTQAANAKLPPQTKLEKELLIFKQRMAAREVRIKKEKAEE